MSGAPARNTHPGAFSRTTVIVLILAGVFSFSALAVLASFAPDLRTGGDPRAHALSKSAVGFGGLVKLLQLRGETVVISRTRAEIANPNVLRILTPDADADPEEVTRLSNRLTLLILPKWKIAVDRRSPDWVSRGGLLPIQAIAEGPLGGFDQVKLARRAGSATVAVNHASDNVAIGQLQVDALQTVSAPGLAPIVTDETGAVILGRLPESSVFVLADPDLLNTYGLRELARAEIGLKVLDTARAGGPLFFDVTLNGYERGRSIWKLAFQPPFLAATLCAAAAAILLGLHAAVRFGPPLREERAIGMGKRALADNQAGLIRMAKREHRMAGPYARLIRDRGAKAVGAGHALEAADLEALLDRLGEHRTQERLSELSAEATKIADPASLTRLARRLYHWKLEITRERQ